MAFQRKILEGLGNLLRNATMPSGVICWFKRDTAPSGWVICDGTNGTPNLIGRYPLGATSGIGATVSAGLPNIRGTAESDWELFAPAETSFTGALSASKSSGKVTNINTTLDKPVRGYTTFKFNASRSNSIYGKSSTVTPPSVKLLPCMKL